MAAHAVKAHEKIYNRYKDVIVPKTANIVYTHTILNTHEPSTTIIVGIRLFPSPLAADIAESINADETSSICPVAIPVIIPMIIIVAHNAFSIFSPKSSLKYFYMLMTAYSKICPYYMMLLIQ